MIIGRVFVHEHKYIEGLNRRESVGIEYKKVE
jgi:hypothetical protein